MRMPVCLVRWLGAAALVVGSVGPVWAQADFTPAFPLTPLFENGTNVYQIAIANDPEGDAQITVTASNATLAPTGSISVACNRTPPTASCFAVFQPAFDESGTTDLVFTLSDPGFPDKVVTQNGLEVVASTAVPQALASVSSTAGTQATFQWTAAPLSGDSDLPSFYMLEIGDAPGLTTFAPIRIPARTSSATLNLPRGGYIFRIRPGNRLGLGPVSAEGSIGLANGADVPGPPAAFRIALSPSGLATATWEPPGVGTAPAFYVIEVGTASGASDIGVFAVPPTGTASGTLGPGTYAVRIHGVSAAGAGPNSPEVFLTIPGATCAPPSAPVLSTILRNGAYVMVPWSAPASGQAEAYVLNAGNSPGASDIAILQVGPSSSYAQLAPPAGTYHVFVQALSSCGAPATSNVVTYVEPAPAAPGPPQALTGTADGPGRATLAWAPPVTGSRVQSYVLEAGFSSGETALVVPLGTLPGISFSDVPAGNYFVRLRATNAFGTSEVSNEITLSIP